MKVSPFLQHITSLWIAYFSEPPKVGADTVLSSIIRLVEQAQGTKAPVQRLADTISSIFVPLVLVIALLTFIGWSVIGNLYGTSVAGGMGAASSPWITVQKRNPYVSLSTIYRTLELLRELGLVRENHLPGEQPHYEEAAGKAHHHLVCRKCRAIIHLDNTLLGNLNEQLQEQYQFHGLTLDLVATGYCDTCWNSLQQELSEKRR